MAVNPAPEQLEYVNDNSTETSINGSFVPEDETTRQFPLNDWIGILPLLIALLGLVGNSLVLWLLGFRIQRNRFSVYILNLAAADVRFLCCTFLLVINIFVHSLSFTPMYWLALYFRYISYSVGLSLLTAISTELCLSVLFPIWYRCHRPKHPSAAVCAVLWAAASLVWVAYVVACFNVYSSPSYEDIFLIKLVCFILLTCVLCVSSLTLLLRGQCSAQRRQPPRLYLLVLLTVLVFLLCGLPMGMWRFIVPLHIDFELYWFPSLLDSVNSSANPIIYLFLGRQRHKRRREPLGLILQRAMGG